MLLFSTCNNCRQRESAERMGEQFREKFQDLKETARDAVQKTGRRWEQESREIGDDAKRAFRTKTNDNAEKYGAGADNPAVQVCWG
jgi:hypothetical protein